MKRAQATLIINEMSETFIFNNSKLTIIYKHSVLSQLRTKTKKLIN